MIDPLSVLSQISLAESDAKTEAERVVCALFRPMAERKAVEYQSLLDRRMPDAIRPHDVRSIFFENSGITGSD